MKIMRFLIMSLALSLSMGAMCQTKVTDPALKKRIQKDAVKEAKRLEKEGWKTIGLPLKKQLERYYTYMYDFDENNQPIYYFGLGVGTAENHDAARMKAAELARLEIVRIVDSKGMSLIDSLFGDDQEEYETVTAILCELKDISNSQKLRPITVVDTYRVLSNEKWEVQMRLAAKSSEIREIVNGYIGYICDEMKKRGINMKEQTLKKLTEKLKMK